MFDDVVAYLLDDVGAQRRFADIPKNAQGHPARLPLAILHSQDDLGVVASVSDHHPDHVEACLF